VCDQRHEHQRGRQVVQQVRQYRGEYRDAEQPGQPGPVRNQPVDQRADPAAAHGQQHDAESEYESAERHVGGAQQANRLARRPANQPANGEHQRPAGGYPRRMYTHRLGQPEADQRHREHRQGEARRRRDCTRSVLPDNLPGMTKKIAISVPDDVAERLAVESNVSAYITDAVRRRMSAERTREALARLGFNITDEDIARAHEEHQQLMATITPELRVKAAAIKAELDRVRANHGAGALHAIERIQQIANGDRDPGRMSP
jgi:hypothetical protein